MKAMANMSMKDKTSMKQLARSMRQHADKGYFDGQDSQTIYFMLASKAHPTTGTQLLFTRDVGYHSCGWFKNPDYERCYHLSLSFWDMQTRQPRPYDNKLARTWVKICYGNWTRYIWTESNHRSIPSTPHHYRVMCDPAWQPIIPRGEVYSKEFTEQGWKSYSERK